MKITNTLLPLGCYLRPIYTEEVKNDRVLISIQNQVNLAFKQYDNFKATKENCQQLMDYLQYQLAQCNYRPESAAKSEIVELITNNIDTLQSGIDLVQTYTPSYTVVPEVEQDFYQQYEKCLEQYKVNGYKHLPIVTDTSKLEGYIRSIPNISGMDVFEFLKAHFYDHLIKLAEPEIRAPKEVLAQEAAEAAKGNCEKYVSRLLTVCIKTFAFIQLTTQKEQYTVIENHYDEADELYDFVQEVGMSVPTEVVKV